MDEKEQSSSKPEEQKPQPPTTAVQQVNNPPKETSDTPKQRDPPKQVEHKPSYTWVKSLQTRADKNWEKIVALLIQAILALFTYLLWGQATTQSKAAMAVVAEYRRNNNLAEKTFESNNESNKLAFELSQKSLQAQISSIEAARAQFEIENKAILGFGIVYDTTTNGNLVCIEETWNFGKAPASVTLIKSHALLTKVESVKSFTYNKAEIHPVSVMFPHGAVFPIKTQPLYIGPAQWDSLIHKRLFGFIYGEIIYRDEATGKYYALRSFYEILPGNLQVEATHNDVIQVPDPTKKK